MDGVMRRSVRKIVMLMSFFLSLAVVLNVFSVVRSVGIEGNYIYLTISSQYVGNYLVVISPLNVSDPNLLTFQNLYVIKTASGQVLYSYLFSNYPPLVIFLEPSAGNNIYGVYYGGTNPYTSYIALPGSSQSLFFLYDDFDYDAGIWNGSYRIYASRMEVKGFVASNISYSGGYSFITNVLGGRALAIVFSVSSGWVTSMLNSSTFADWNSIIDGSDIFFLDPSGNPTNYSIIYLDKTSQILYFSVYLNNFSMVYMLYGGANPYVSYRT
jgi:hypothetical protein